jgi:hypothetical protein
MFLLSFGWVNQALGWMGIQRGNYSAFARIWMPAIASLFVTMAVTIVH